MNATRASVRVPVQTKPLGRFRLSPEPAHISLCDTQQALHRKLTMLGERQGATAAGVGQTKDGGACISNRPRHRYGRHLS
ncbi:hypothetical protein EV184_13339 [Sinorhizobium americanum]|uniref:Uncharacterized protein n=1 Tax=Sinorhizobium americanum TaxID=194963 RepID=A0A4R2B021_9HYPH|nr:hypothetical protein EV184_13339 [Sinorhizobium americanum]